MNKNIEKEENKSNALMQKINTVFSYLFAISFLVTVVFIISNGGGLVFIFYFPTVFIVLGLLSIIKLLFSFVVWYNADENKIQVMGIWSSVLALLILILLIVIFSLGVFF